MWAIGWSTTGSWITAFTFGAFGPPASLESGAQRTKQLERVGGFFQDFGESRTENGTEEPLRGVRHSAFEGTATSVNPSCLKSVSGHRARSAFSNAHNSIAHRI